jgi:protein-tyrosine-phosphatase
MKILFVCTGNACRSPVAEALMKKFNSEIDAESAGTHAYYRIVDVAADYLRKNDAEQYLKRTPQDLDSKLLNEYDLIVAMEQKHKHFILKICPECAGKVIVWNIADPYKLPAEHAEKIFTQIREKVEELADQVKTS